MMDSKNARCAKSHQKRVRKLRKEIIIVLTVLLFVSSGCIEQIGFNSDKSEGTVLDKGFENCESGATELLPETLQLRNDGGKTWVYYGEQQWKDGTLIEYWGVSFKRGERTGQNTDYYYIDEISKSLTYSKKIASRDGTILGIRTFSMRPVLKAVEDSEVSYKGKFLGHSTQEFVIIEPEFADCVWLKRL